MHGLSTSNLAEYLAVTKRTIQRRANRESWQYNEQIGLGGTRRIYSFAALPVDVKQRVISQIIAIHEKQGVEYQPDRPPLTSVFNLKQNPFIVLDKANSGDWLSQHSFAHQIDSAELNKEYIKVGLLVLAYLYVSHFSVGKIKGFDQFCKLYNSRELALQISVFDVVKSISRITLIRWERELQNTNFKQRFMAETDNNEVLFGRDLQQISEQMSMISPNIKAKRLHQYLLTIYADRKIPSQNYLSQWLKSQKATQNQLT